jgi:hypothetical protein
MYLFWKEYDCGVFFLSIHGRVLVSGIADRALKPTLGVVDPDNMQTAPREVGSL